jgi:hypothetical protein
MEKYEFKEFQDSIDELKQTAKEAKIENKKYLLSSKLSKSLGINKLIAIAGISLPLLTFGLDLSTYLNNAEELSNNSQMLEEKVYKSAKILKTSKVLGATALLYSLGASGVSYANYRRRKNKLEEELNQD